MLGVGAFAAVLSVTAAIVLAARLVTEPHHVHVVGHTAPTRSASGFTDRGALSKTLSYPEVGYRFTSPGAAKAAITPTEAFAAACKSNEHLCATEQATIFLADVSSQNSFGEEA